MRIIIKSTNVTSEKTQKGNVLVKQQAAIDQGLDFPMAFSLTVDQPYPAGSYELAPGSFRVNQFGSLELNPYDLKLVPVKA